MVMDKTGNFLQMMVQDKMVRSRPENVMAQKELDIVNQNPNYLKEQFETRRNSQRLQYEKDLMDWAVKSLNFIDTEEYPQFRETAIKYGINPALLPEGFDSPELFEEFKMKASIGVPEYKKLMDGKAVTMSKVTRDGLISTVTAKNNEQIQAYAKDGYSLGKLTGTPTKKQFEHKPVYDAAGRIKKYKSIEKGKDFIFSEGEFGNAPDKSKSSTPTPQQALKRISDINKARATLDKSSEVTQMLASLNPELKDMVGQKIKPELQQQLYDAWDNEIAYLEQFTKKQSTELPEGLTREMLDQYKKQYPGKTEQQIIEAWKRRAK